MRTQFTLQNVMGFTKALAVAGRRWGLAAIAFCLYSFQTVQAQTNLALGKTVYSSGQISPLYPPSNLTDGNVGTFAHTTNVAPAPTGEWFQIDLGADYYIDRIVIKNRTDCCGGRSQRFMVVTYPSFLPSLGAAPAPYVDDSRYNKLLYGDLTKLSNPETISQATAVKAAGVDLGPAYTVLDMNVGVHLARHVFILSLQDDYFNLAEVEVYGTTTVPVRTFVNTGFEAVGPSTNTVNYIPETQVPGWSTTEGIANLTGSVYAPSAPVSGATNGGVIEIWGSGTVGVPSFEGGKHAELNAFMNGELSQQPICVLAGETFNWSLAHRGRNGVDVMRLRIDNVDVAEFSDNNATAGTHTATVLTPSTTTATKVATNADGWTQYNGTWTNTSGTAKVVQFAFRAVSAVGGSGAGNFLDAVSIAGLQATVTLHRSDESGLENIATANLPKIYINGAITTPQTVQLNITGGTATRGTDYVTSPTTGPITVTIPVGTYDGTAATAISLAPFIQIQTDATSPEPDETILMALQTPSVGLVLPTASNSCGLGGTTSTYTILDLCIARITPSVTSLTTCSGDSVNINYTTVPTGSEVNWTRLPDNLVGAGNVIDFPTASGTTPVSYTYIATVFSPTGCTSETAVTTVLVNPVPVVTPSVYSQTICSGQTGNITFTTTIPGSTINWVRTPATPAPSSGTGNISQVLTNTGPTSVTYTYQIWAVSPAPASCPSSATITSTIVVQPALTVAALANSATVCVGSPLSLSATVTPTGTYTYAWSGPNGYASTGANPTVSATAALTNSGTYTVVVTDAVGCSGTATVSVSVTNCCDLVASATPTSVTSCLSPNTGSITISYTGTGTYQYTLNGGGFQALGASPATISNLAAGSYTIVVQAVVDPTCSQTLGATIDSPATPPVFALSNSPLCTGSTLSLSATGNYTSYAWSGPSGFVSNQQNPSLPNATTLASGVYTVSITNAGGCTASASTTVVIASQPSLTVTAGSGLTVCSGQSTMLNVGGTNNAPVTWTNNLGQSGSGTTINFAGITNLSGQPQTITYVISANAGACSDSETIDITINPAPILQVVPQQAVICLLEQAQIVATTTSATATINWTRIPTSPNPPAISGTGTGSVTVNQVLPAGNYTYTFTATEGGCTSSPVTTLITVLP